MNHFNEPHRLNRFIELDRLTTNTPGIESTEMRLQRVRRQICAAVDGISTKRNHNVRLNRNH